MAGIVKGAAGLVGNTPLLEPVNLEKKEGLKARILLKLEYFNPAGSVKDRVGKASETASIAAANFKDLLYFICQILFPFCLIYYFLPFSALHF